MVLRAFHIMHTLPISRSHCRIAGLSVNEYANKDEFVGSHVSLCFQYESKGALQTIPAEFLPSLGRDLKAGSSRAAMIELTKLNR